MHNIEASWGLKFLWSTSARAAAGLKQLRLLHKFSYDVQEGVFLKSLFGGWEGNEHYARVYLQRKFIKVL